MMKELESFCCEEWLRAGTARPAPEEDPWEISNTYKCLKAGCEDDGATLFLVVHSTRTRGNGDKLKHGSLLLNTR